MKKVLLYSLLLFAAACTSFDSSPYGDSLRTFTARLVYPEDFTQFMREGVPVKLIDRNSSNSYVSKTNANGEVEFIVAAGHYRLSVFDKPEANAIFNGSMELVNLTQADADVNVMLKYAKPGSILIKEIYSGGCPMDAPASGSYTYDKYVILHNNNPETLYLDGLCFGIVAPYNSNASNPWTSKDPSGNIVFRPYAALPDCIWQFGGEGNDFPLEPGAEAVIAFEAIDHTQTYSLSVNLNRSGYFVIYDQLLYPGNKAHPTPVPGDQILPSHYIKVAKKTGKSGESGANTYVMSQNSPTVILFRAPDGFDLDAYLANDLESTIAQGSISYSMIPWGWIIDGVEAYNASEATRNKRLHHDVDAGYVGFSAKPQGHTLHRKRDAAASDAAGYDVYVDTNNSSNDFEERATQSLRK